MSPVNKCWGYYGGTFQCSQVFSTHLKMSYVKIKSTDARSLDELQWFNWNTGPRDSSPSNTGAWTFNELFRLA